MKVFLRVVNAIQDTIDHDSTIASTLNSSLLYTIRDLGCCLQQIKTVLSSSLPNDQYSVTVTAVPTGQRGQPKVSLSIDYVIGLRELGFSWTKVASILGISRRTLYSHRLEMGLTGDGDPFAMSEITDHDLDQRVQDIKSQMPYIGIRMVHGTLRSRGVRVPQYRVRDCLHRIDPINTALRWACPISRRTYCVPGPNFLWHIDGNHKLIR